MRSILSRTDALKVINQAEAKLAGKATGEQFSTVERYLPATAKSSSRMARKPIACA